MSNPCFNCPHQATCQYYGLGICDAPGNATANTPIVNEMLESQESTPSFWTKFRAEAAKDILFAIIRRGLYYEPQNGFQLRAADAIKQADELIKQLREESK